MTHPVHTLSDLSPEELTEAYHSEARELSYFNAAEGPEWSRESVQRGKCRDRYGDLRNEFARRGIPVPKGDYLI